MLREEKKTNPKPNHTKTSLKSHPLIALLEYLLHLRGTKAKQEKAVGFYSAVGTT